jgi:hypothetical protein
LLYSGHSSTKRGGTIGTLTAVPIIKPIKKESHRALIAKEYTTGTSVSTKYELCWDEHHDKLNFRILFSNSCYQTHERPEPHPAQAAKEASS